ncbi:MAG: PAS domain-containing protein, partial [Gemmatimonadetes bacterium]|nr:PAS domain-containing protein [Gemmatimonadota bacterium]
MGTPPVLDADGGVTWHGICSISPTRSGPRGAGGIGGDVSIRWWIRCPTWSGPAGPTGLHLPESAVGRVHRPRRGKGTSAAAGRTRVHPEDRERVLAEWRQAVATGADHHTELRLRRADGAYRWFSTSGRAAPRRG